jgi:hypothetical protein
MQFINQVYTLIMSYTTSQVVKIYYLLKYIVFLLLLLLSFSFSFFFFFFFLKKRRMFASKIHYFHFFLCVCVPTLRAIIILFYYWVAIYKLSWFFPNKTQSSANRIALVINCPTIKFTVCYFCHLQTSVWAWILRPGDTGHSDIIPCSIICVLEFIDAPLSMLTALPS